MAGRYRKVDTRIWNDAKFRELTDDGKFVFLFLLTHPGMTSLGAMRATLAGLSDELGWQGERFREAFREAFAKGMADHDEKACYIGLPNFLKYNLPESPNVVKSWDKLIDLLPECESLEHQTVRVASAVAAIGKAFSEALPEAFRKASANPSGRPPLIPNPNPNPNKSKNEDSCTEPAKAPSSVPAANPDDPIVLIFPCVGKGPKEWPLHESKLREYTEAFPGVDALAELRKARQWLRDNPSRQKTAAGVARFLNNWLGKAQDHGTQHSNTQRPGGLIPHGPGQIFHDENGRTDADRLK